MIATILPSSTNFHAVEYNEMKVAKGKAELIEMSNFGYIGMLGSYTPEELTNYLVSYSASNSRIKNAQFHLAISCKGNEYSQEELVRIAKQYLKEMGYGEPGQPVLIYAHHDTDNNHIHVITSRVDPHGKKINHNHERLRSQEVINRIMGVNEQQRIGEAVSEALQYSFSSIPHFRAILETMGYECFSGKNELILKRGGVIQDRVKNEVIESHCMEEKIHDKKTIAQIRAILRKYRDMSSDKTELRDTMKSKFGIDLLYMGSKDTPYGYLIVDHKNKSVYKGSEILKIKELLVFQSMEDRFRHIDSFIDKILDDDVFLTTKELNKMLRRQFGCKLMNGCVLFNGNSHQIPDYMSSVLKMNDRREWIQSFCPSTEEEKDILCSIGKYYHSERINIVEKNKEKTRLTQNQLKSIFELYSGQDLWDIIREDGYMIVKKEDNFYCIDFKNKTIHNMAEYDLDLSRLRTRKETEDLNDSRKSNNMRVTILPGKILKKKGGSTDSNREWEVEKGNYDDVDDERKLKR